MRTKIEAVLTPDLAPGPVYPGDDLPGMGLLLF